jgi:serine/threonine protein kinase
MNGEVIRGTEFNYRIDKEFGINGGFIAEGTESIVYKGVKYGNDLRYSCALKFKPISRLTDFMEREYRILESMQTCRSVVRVLDVIEDIGDFKMPYSDGEINRKNFFCVVEEYIDGESLQDYCIKQWFTYNKVTRKWERNSTPYSYREIVKYQNQLLQFMINLCEIMKFVSNINRNNGKVDTNKPVVLHCDLKPENIMVTEHGKELVLIDFGRSQQFMNARAYQHYSNRIAKTYEADYSNKQFQDVGKENLYAYGTVGYAAPECYAAPRGGLFPFITQRPALTCGCVSVESDIFGFGATFSECFSIYELCQKIYSTSENHGDLRLFNRRILKATEEQVRNGTTELYCDRDFRGIDSAYHEAIEDILRKCTKTRYVGFQNPGMTPKEYYHNFYQLQEDIERARDVIPSLDRKSDPLVRQMLGVSGFCAVFAACFFFLWFLLFILANPLARDRWDTLKQSYTDNQTAMLMTVADDMLDVPGKKTRQENFEDVLEFTYSGEPNDTVVDRTEAEILTTLLKERMQDSSTWGEYLDTIIIHAKSDHLDDIAELVYYVNLPDDAESVGYELSKALTQINNADDRDADALLSVYETLMEYADREEYATILSKLSIKLMSGRKIDTLAEALEKTREEIQDELTPITKLGDE